MPSFQKIQYSHTKFSPIKSSETQLLSNPLQQRWPLLATALSWKEVLKAYWESDHELKHLLDQIIHLEKCNVTPLPTKLASY